MGDTSILKRIPDVAVIREYWRTWWNILLWFGADDQSPASLQMLSRAAIRLAVRGGVMRRAPDLREPPPVPPPTPRNAPRRICIPYEAPSDDGNACLTRFTQGYRI